MRLKVLIILFIVWASQGVSQHSYFKEYRDLENNTLLDVIEVNDGFVYCGKQQIFGNDELSGLLWKTDLKGSTEWQRLIHENDADVFHQLIVHNGDLYVIGASHQQNPTTGRIRKLIKFSSDGIKQWDVEFGDTVGAFFDNNLYELLDVGDGLIVASSGYGNAVNLTDGELYKLDYDGNVLWSKQYSYVPVGQNSYDVVLNIKQDADGYIFLLYSYVSYAPSHEEHIIKVDEYGNEMWRKKVSDYPVSPELTIENTINTVVNVVPYNDGYIALMQALGVFEEVMRTYLLELDANGNEVEITTYLDGIWHESLTMEVNENDEIYVFTRHSLATILYQLGLIKFNSDKSMAWYKTYGSEDFSEWQMSGILTSDGGSLISGRNFHVTPGEIEYDNLVAAKVDCEGNLAWRDECSFVDTEMDVLIFPNPSSGNYTFQLQNIDENSEIELLIYDNIGRLISLNAHKSRFFSVDISTVVHGVYYYVLKVNQSEYATGKLLKI